jgi:hypothetical protein
METTAHTTHRAARLVLAAALVVAGLATASPAGAYGWPVKPFHRQHPVRAYLGDPRIGGTSHTLHFGIDVAAPNGTPVYATISGRIGQNQRHPDVVLVQAGDVTFEYWHIVPVVRSGYAVAYRTLLGRVEKPWAHVHFAERHGSTYVNPLRPGGLLPYCDTTKPTVAALRVESRGRNVAARPVSGRVDLVAEAYDTTPLPVPAPWNDKPVAPALVEWRLVGGRTAAAAWTVAADFRSALPTCSFSSVYTPETQQNHASTQGVYRFVLVRGWDAGSVKPGTYTLQVRVADTAGHTATGSLVLAIGEPQA